MDGRGFNKSANDEIRFAAQELNYTFPASFVVWSNLLKEEHAML